MIVCDKCMYKLTPELLKEGNGYTIKIQSSNPVDTELSMDIIVCYSCAKKIVHQIHDMEFDND